jgi:uncharacterized protein with HEPN domain
MIEQFTAGMEFNAFREDPRTITAVERKLQILSAATRLGGFAADLPFRGIRIVPCRFESGSSVWAYCS